MTAIMAADMRTRAERFRKMAEDGDDLRIKALLLRLAAEFDEEAARIEALEAAQRHRTIIRAGRRHDR